MIRLLASSALSALITMAFAAGAEPADESTPSEHFRNAEGADTAEVVVTAQRRKERLSDVGMTVASVDGELLNERRIDTAADLTQVVSALSVAENADGTPVYTLRGVGFNSTSLGAQPTVSIYQDEAPLPYGPMTQGPLFDLERVEVLKGPQGTLYGQNSTGGAINYIAAKPTDHFSTGVNASIGRFATFQGQGFVSGPLTEGLTALCRHYSLGRLAVQLHAQRFDRGAEEARRPAAARLAADRGGARLVESQRLDRLWGTHSRGEDSATIAEWASIAENSGSRATCGATTDIRRSIRKVAAMNTTGTSVLRPRTMANRGEWRTSRL
jgi:outer membrane receptor protein involved in Fe transport